MLALALPALLPAQAQAATPTATVTAVPCEAPGAPAAPRIKVEVTGARNAHGNMTVTLYGPDQARFLASRGKLARERVPLHGTTAEACFAVSAPGEYAIAVYHDENNDHDFNRTIVGMPKEGYGFSNDAPTTMGLPSFDSVKFRVGAEGATVPVTLRY